MITLSLIEKQDLIKILEWNQGKSADFLLQWAGPKYEYPLTMEQLEEYIIGETQQEGSGTFIYKIVLDETGEVVGTVELREADKEKKEGRVGRFLIGAESARGKGIGTEALNKLVKIGFEELGFEKITLGVFDFNYNAVRCYEKSGFVKEKLRENYRRASNGYWNLHDMGISKEKWSVQISK